MSVPTFEAMPNVSLLVLSSRQLPSKKAISFVVYVIPRNLQQRYKSCTPMLYSHKGTVTISYGCLPATYLVTLYFLKCLHCSYDLCYSYFNILEVTMNCRGITIIAKKRKIYNTLLLIRILAEIEKNTMEK